MAYARAQMGTPPTPPSLVSTGNRHPPVGNAALREATLPRVLSLDARGRILDWMHWQDAVCLYVRGAVAWTLGEPCLTVHGGYNRSSGQQSILDLHPIVAAKQMATADHIGDGRFGGGTFGR